MLRWAEAEGLAVGLVGSGSNLLVADDGFHGLAIKLDGELATIEREGERVLCGGGARLPSAAAKAAGWGLSGLEFGINIPGTAGGAVRMNANAYGGQLARVLEWVEVCTAAGTRAPRPRAARLRLPAAPTCARAKSSPAPPSGCAPATRSEIRATLAAMRERRREAQPSGIKTFGSTFKNPEDERAEGRSAGQLLEAAGCRGLRHGGARFSEKHANFVENTGEATTADVLELMAEGRRRVHERFGVELEPEVQVLGEVRWPAGLGAVSRAAGDRAALAVCSSRRSPSTGSSSATTTVEPHGPGAATWRRRSAAARKRSRSAGNGAVVRWLPLPEDPPLPRLPLDEPPKGRRSRGPTLEQARVLGAAPPALRPYVAGSYYGESGVDVELTSGDRTALRRRLAGAAEVEGGGGACSPIPSIEALDYVDLHAPGRPAYGGSGHDASARSLNPGGAA